MRDRRCNPKDNQNWNRANPHEQESDRRLGIRVQEECLHANIRKPSTVQNGANREQDLSEGRTACKRQPNRDREGTECEWHEEQAGRKGIGYGAQEERPNQDDGCRRPKRRNRPDASPSNGSVGSGRGTGGLRLHCCIGPYRKTDCAPSLATIHYAQFLDARAIDGAFFFECHGMTRASQPKGRSCPCLAAVGGTT